MFFFFSSRRRHTRFKCDWSSDVCSSDLIEIDRAEINKNVKVDVALVGDAREVLERLIPHIQTCDHSAWIRHVAELKGDSAVRDIQSLPDNGHLYAAHVINDIWKETPGTAIGVTYVGRHQT